MPTLEELGDLFDDPDFDEQLDVMNPLGDEPVEVSSLPTLELPDTVLFPDETVTLTVSRTDALLRLVEQGSPSYGMGDALPATIVKLPHPGSVSRVRTMVACARSARSRSSARYGPGEASLHVLTCARVIDGEDQDVSPRRNPVYPVFGACADFPELRENFVKLIRQSPGIDAVPGSNLLDTLAAIDLFGREYDEQYPD